MKKLYCVICRKYRKLKNFKISHISITCENEGEKTFQKEESIMILKNCGLSENILQKYVWRKHKPRI